MGSPSARSPGELLLDEGEQLSTLAFTRWKVEMANKLVVDQEKASAKERIRFKEKMDKQFTERKQNVHRRVGDEFGNSKVMVEAVANANLEKGLAYKQGTLPKYKERIQVHKDEWANYGHELTIRHGKEQADRTRQSIAESIDEKAHLGQKVRGEIMNQANQVQTQRKAWMEEKRDHVATLKNEKIGKVDAAKRSMFEEKVDAVQSVKDIEERWRHLTQRERDDFLGHALDNHKKADFTKEQMRGARRELRSKNARHVELERQRKEGDKDIIEERKEREEVAKRALRDGVYSARSISPDKSRQVAKAASRSTSKSPTKRRAQEKALATLADLGVPLPPGSPPSPYKLP